MPKNNDKSTRIPPIQNLGRPVCMYEGDEPRFAIITGPGAAEGRFTATVFRPNGEITATQIGKDDCADFYASEAPLDDNGDDDNKADDANTPSKDDCADFYASEAPLDDNGDDDNKADDANTPS